MFYSRFSYDSDSRPHDTSFYTAEELELLNKQQAAKNREPKKPLEERIREIEAKYFSGER